jgi:sec-independent protein translocase protein TatB
MFSSLGITELLIIAGVALVVLGPDKFPQVAKVAIRMFREVRGYWEDAKRDISKELRPVDKEMRELRHYKPEDYIDSLVGDDDDEEDEYEAVPDEAQGDTEDPYASSEHDYSEEMDDYDDYEQYAQPEEGYGQNGAQADFDETDTTTANEDSDFGTDEPDLAESGEDSGSGTAETQQERTNDAESSLPERLDG